MNRFTRYGLYYLPPAGSPLANFGAAWLGWDVDRGDPVAQAPDLAHLTDTPRKYGFHATLKPPFRLTDGTTAGALHTAVAGVASTVAPVRLQGLRLSRIGGFLALVPSGDVAALNVLAARLVADLDPFRAPPTPADLARRRTHGLTPGQEARLLRWGYPYVMEEFRFHMTLSGDLSPDDIALAEARLAPVLADIPLSPFLLDEVALVGERADGMFQTIQRYSLSG